MRPDDGNGSPGNGRPHAKIDSLTGLRFFAASWVVLRHYSYLIALPSGVRVIAVEGVSPLTKAQ
jgi:peptidoglycan/LPS O-acetylase OafA/YrhL